MRLDLFICGVAASLAVGLARAQTPAAQAAIAAPGCCLIAAGTPVEIELTELVTSRRATSGDKYTLKLARDLVVGDVVVIPAGAPGRGEVVDAGPAGLAGRPGKLILAARSLEAGAIHVPLRSFHLAGSGRDDSKSTMVLMNTPYVGILAVFVHGGNIDYPAGTRAIAKVAADTFIPSPGPPSSPTAPTPPIADPSAPPQEKKP